MVAPPWSTHSPARESFTNDIFCPLKDSLGQRLPTNTLFVSTDCGCEFMCLLLPVTRFRWMRYWMMCCRRCEVMMVVYSVAWHPFDGDGRGIVRGCCTERGVIWWGSGICKPVCFLRQGPPPPPPPQTDVCIRLCPVVFHRASLRPRTPLTRSFTPPERSSMG